MFAERRFCAARLDETVPAFLPIPSRGPLPPFGSLLQDNYARYILIDQFVTNFRPVFLFSEQCRNGASITLILSRCQENSRIACDPAPLKQS